MRKILRKKHGEQTADIGERKAKKTKLLFKILVEIIIVTYTHFLTRLSVIVF